MSDPDYSDLYKQFIDSLIFMSFNIETDEQISETSVRFLIE